MKDKTEETDVSSVGSRRYSSLSTVAAVAVCAYAACDMVHEVLGHGTASLLIPGVHAVSLSTVALQTVGRSSRLVAAAGTVANVIVGIVSLLLARRVRRFTAARYFLLLFASVNLLNGTGYLLFSAIFDIGDWAVVIAGLQPTLAWRVGLCLIGAASYVSVIVITAREFTSAVHAEILARSEVPRLIYPAYITGGALLVAGSALNPISASLILSSGASSGFAAMAGLLFVPGMVEASAAAAVPSDGFVHLSRAWIGAGIACGALFVGIIGRGIRL